MGRVAPAHHPGPAAHAFLAVTRSYAAGGDAKRGYVPERTHPTDRARDQTVAMPTAVAAAWQSHPDHPLVRLETAPSSQCHAVSLQETPSETFTACAAVIFAWPHGSGPFRRSRRSASQRRISPQLYLGVVRWPKRSRPAPGEIPAPGAAKISSALGRQLEEIFAVVNFRLEPLLKGDFEHETRGMPCFFRVRSR